MTLLAAGEFTSTDPGVRPEADIFPMLSRDDLTELGMDIQARGQLHPILLHPDGRIIDGRNRYKACTKMRIEPVFAPWTGEPGTELAFVISQNLRRRHLDTSQRAIVAAKIADMRKGARTDLQPKAELHEVSIAEAASKLNVSPRSVKSAKVVLDKADPAITALVEGGQVSVAAAEKVARLPADEQARIVADADDSDALAQVVKASAAKARRVNREAQDAEVVEDTTAKAPVLPIATAQHLTESNRAELECLAQSLLAHQGTDVEPISFFWFGMDMAANLISTSDRAQLLNDCVQSFRMRDDALAKLREMVSTITAFVAEVEANLEKEHA